MQDLILDGIACYRLTRLIHSDAIFDEHRAALTGWLLERGYRKTRYLLQCPYCLGIWSAAIVLALRGSRLRDLLAVAGVSAVLYDLLEPSTS